MAVCLCIRISLEIYIPEAVTVTQSHIQTQINDAAPGSLTASVAADGRTEQKGETRERPADGDHESVANGYLCSVVTLAGTAICVRLGLRRLRRKRMRVSKRASGHLNKSGTVQFG